MDDSSGFALRVAVIFQSSKSVPVCSFWPEIGGTQPHFILILLPCWHRHLMLSVQFKKRRNEEECLRGQSQLVSWPLEVPHWNAQRFIINSVSHRKCNHKTLVSSQVLRSSNTSESFRSQVAAWHSFTHAFTLPLFFLDTFCHVSLCALCKPILALRPEGARLYVNGHIFGDF